jgi:hypothetical protein
MPYFVTQDSFHRETHVDHRLMIALREMAADDCEQDIVHGAEVRRAIGRGIDMPQR